MENNGYEHFGGEGHYCQSLKEQRTTSPIEAKMREAFKLAALEWATACMMKRPLDECNAALDFAWGIARQSQTEREKPLVEALRDFITSVKSLGLAEQLRGEINYAEQSIANIEQGGK